MEEQRQEYHPAEMLVIDLECDEIICTSAYKFKGSGINQNAPSIDEGSLILPPEDGGSF